MGARGTDQIPAGEAGATAMVSTGKGLREEDTREAPIRGQRRALERRGKGGARGGEEHWLAHLCGQSAEIAGEEMRPLAVLSERKSEENGERWKKEKNLHGGGRA
jgi:hypothetical protein